MSVTVTRRQVPRMLRARGWTTLRPGLWKTEKRGLKAHTRHGVLLEEAASIECIDFYKERPRAPKELSRAAVKRILRDIGSGLLDDSLALRGFETRGTAEIPGAVQLLIRVKDHRPSEVTIWIQRREWI